MANPFWQPSGSLSLNPPGTNIFDPQVYGTINRARSNSSAYNAWRGAMNSGGRRQQASARRGNPRALEQIARMGPNVPVGSPQNVRGITQQGFDDALDMESGMWDANDFHQRMQGAFGGVATPTMPQGGAVTAPGLAGGRVLPDGSVGRTLGWTAADEAATKGSTQLLGGGNYGNMGEAAGAGIGRFMGPLSAAASPLLGALGRRVGEAYSSQPSPSGAASTTSVAPATTAAASAPLAPAQPSMFDIARAAVDRRKREQEEMGLRDRDLGSVTERKLPGGTMLTSDAGYRSLYSQYGGTPGNPAGFSTPTPEGAAKSFNGMPGLSYFQDAANRQGVGNGISTPDPRVAAEAAARERLIMAGMQQAMMQRARR